MAIPELSQVTPYDGYPSPGRSKLMGLCDLARELILYSPRLYSYLRLQEQLHLLNS